MKQQISRFALFLAVGFSVENIAFADGMLANTATSTAVIANSVGITTPLSAISLGNIDLADNVLASGSGTFVVTANSAFTAYDVWMSVPTANIDTVNHVYLARAGDNNLLPLNVSLTGNAGTNAVNANPAMLQIGPPTTARPPSGSKSDGDNVNGTNRTGTTYTVTLTENNSLVAVYPDVPAATYTIPLTANVAQN